MNTGHIMKTAVGYLWRLPLCAGAYVAGAAGGGALVQALGLSLPELPPQADGQTTGLFLVLGSLILTLGLSPLARRLRGGFAVRWLTLAGLCYVCLGVNTPLEAAIFTNMGGMASIPVLSILPCLLFAAAVALLFPPASKGESFPATARRFFASRTAGEWAWRLAAGVAAFPAVYWTFGLMVAPFVRPYYEQGQFGLVLPGVGVIVLVQLLRSALLLLVALPALIVGAGSNRRLVPALGLALYMLVGLFSMIQAYWLAPTLLVLHNLEIFADSMVYALVLVLLLAPGRAARAEDLSARLLPWREPVTIEK
jgi:hypothetical protein